jgi:signal transduction histidine kinase
MPERQVDNLGKVLTSAEHLLNLINTILDIAKIEAGRMDVIPSKFDPEKLVEMCVNTTRPLLKPEVEVELIAAPDLPQANTDQDKVRQIILNLLSNAAKFTRQGQIIVRLNKNATCLLIEVEDTGIGITPEQLNRIFEEFQQADSSTTREYGGTGLGLSISKHLAQLLGGSLTAAGTPEQGSTFSLEIPFTYT